MTDTKHTEDKAQELGDEIESFNFDDADFDLKKQNTPTTQSNAFKARIPIMIGSVLGVFLIYKGVDWYFLGHKKSEHASMAAAKNSDVAIPHHTEDAPSAPNQGTEDAMAFLSEMKQINADKSLDTKLSTAIPATASATTSTGAPVVSDTATPAPMPSAAPAAVPAAAGPTAPLSTAPTAIPATAIPTTAGAALLPPTVTGPQSAPGVDLSNMAPPTGAEGAAGSAATPDLSQLQQKLDGQTEETDKRLEAMDRAIYRLSKRMEQVQDGVGQLSTDMNSIQQSLTILATQMKKMSEPMDAPLKSDIAKTETFASPNYSVYAIIPGRAWLKDKSGRTLTVTEGDVLEQYGKVLVIDAQNSVVITSSGVTLR